MNLQDIYNKVLHKVPYKSRTSLVRLYEGEQVPRRKKSVAKLYNEVLGGDKDSNPDNTPINTQQAQANTPPTPVPTPVPPVPAPVPETKPSDVFTIDYSTGKKVLVWEDQIQQVLFPKTNPGDTRSGPGEFAVAALVFAKHDPALYAEISAQGIDAMYKYLVNNYVAGGSVSYDIKVPGTNYKYEVKQITEKTTARTGTEGKRAAKELLSKVHKNVNLLYKAYSNLDTEGKAKVDSFNKMGYTIGGILSTAHTYFDTRPGELPAGAYSSKYDVESDITEAKGSTDKTKRIAIPKLSILPNLIEQLCLSENIKEELPLTVKDVGKIYNTSEYNARVIDYTARKYLKHAGVDVEAKFDPATMSKIKLSDFILACKMSVFQYFNQFKQEVVSYFTPGTANHTTALRESLPVTGVFTATETGYTYTGFNILEKTLKITSITIGGFKLSVQGEAEV